MRTYLALGFLATMGLTTIGCAAEPTADDPSVEQGADLNGDKTDPKNAAADRIAATATVWNRTIRLHMSDGNDAGWASIDDGNPGDEAWLDRSFDGGVSWGGGSKLGDTKIPAGSRGWRTMMYSIDDPKAHDIGAIRACGKAGDRVEIACTPWFRSTAKSPLDGAARALMANYDNGAGKWNKIGWWNSANALTALIDYSQATGNQDYRYAIETTFDDFKGSHIFSGETDFTNKYMDDTGWWGLAWVRAYDLNKDSKFLDMAKKDADYIYGYKDGTCGGGIWWNTDKKYKNAITNELYIKLAAQIHNRTPGDTKYGAQANEIWSWFKTSGMINAKNLINDGLTTDCKNNNGTTWTYNQGVILGGLVELNMIDEAKTLAEASTADAALNPTGILREPCESSADHCGGDGPSFKGIYVRNLGELDRAAGDHPFKSYLNRQAAALSTSHDSLDQYGVSWGGPIDSVDASRQHSALDALTAAYWSDK
jgi:predicted alpha-1,6-mannanase (GH76 family)